MQRAVSGPIWVIYFDYGKKYDRHKIGIRVPFVIAHAYGGLRARMAIRTHGHVVNEVWSPEEEIFKACLGISTLRALCFMIMINVY